MTDLGRLLRSHGSVGLRGVFAKRPLLLAWLGLVVVSTALAAGDGTAPIAAIAAGAGVFAASALAFWLQYGRSRDRIAIHEHGLAWTHRGRARAVPWRDLVGLDVAHIDQRRRRAPGTVPRDRFRMTLDDGAAAWIDPEIRRVRELTAEIERRAAPAMAARGQSHLDVGNTLLFGSAVVHRDGVAPHGDILPWQDLVGIAIDDGRVALVFATYGRFPVGRYAEIPAAWAVIELCRRSVARAGGAMTMPAPAGRVERRRASLFD